MVGESIAVEGLSSTFTDVLVRLEDIAGTTQTERLTPTKTSFVVKATPGASEVAVTYLWLGIEHILLGFDHLLFVLALVILVRQWARVVVTVTAFTVAHSITLAAATLGFVHVPGPPVEATIALSIMLVAAEIVNARRGHPSLTARWPWLVAFAFGLLHGFGFAGALREVGLPQHAIPLALLFFNLGVEVGQLAFVALVMALAWWLPRALEHFQEKWEPVFRPKMRQAKEEHFQAKWEPVFRPKMRRAKEARLTLVGRDWTRARLDAAAAYAIGTLAAYWVIERTVGFWA